MDESRSTPAAAPRVKTRGNDPLIGRFINERYKILALIARGGMGKVYRAEQAPLGRLVALKVLNPNYHGDGDPEFHKRFFLEASIASKLTHPNTVTIHDYGKTEDEIYYIAMELLEGRTLLRALREAGSFGEERTLNIARQICRALREAHGLGVIHRDLKPANVYLLEHDDESDYVKVLDFGLVKNLDDKGEQLTQTGLFMGSPKYMSPEQIRGERVDSRIDIYALGVMMCEMLTGKPPFDSANSVNILMAHIHEPVPSLRELNPTLQISPELEYIVQKCMAKKADQRFSSMNELLTALKACGGPNAIGTSTGEFRIPSSLETPIGGESILPRLEGGLLSANADNANSTTTQAAPFAQAIKSKSGPLLLSALFAFTGIVGFVALSKPFEQRPRAPAVASHAPGAQPASGAQDPGGQPEAPARTVLVSLRSRPAGAMVVVGDKEYGPTPTELEWTGADAELGRQVTFRFRRTGYRALTVTREVRGDRPLNESKTISHAATPSGLTN